MPPLVLERSPRDTAPSAVSDEVMAGRSFMHLSTGQAGNTAMAAKTHQVDIVLIDAQLLATPSARGSPHSRFTSARD